MLPIFWLVVRLWVKVSSQVGTVGTPLLGRSPPPGWESRPSSPSPLPFRAARKAGGIGPDLGGKGRRRWRPYWGFVSGTAFGIQIFGLMFIMGWAVIAKPEEAAVIIERLAGLASSLMTTWALALAVLGVAVWKRSEDKKAQAGLNPKGIIEALRGK